MKNKIWALIGESLPHSLHACGFSRVLNSLMQDKVQAPLEGLPHTLYIHKDSHQYEFSYVNQIGALIEVFSTFMTYMRFLSMWNSLMYNKIWTLIKVFPHSLHTYGFFPVWILWCIIRFELQRKVFPHSPYIHEFSLHYQFSDVIFWLLFEALTTDFISAGSFSCRKDFLFHLHPWLLSPAITFFGVISFPWSTSLLGRGMCLTVSSKELTQYLNNLSIRINQFQITDIPGRSVFGVFHYSPNTESFPLKFPSLTSNLLSPGFRIWNDKQAIIIPKIQISPLPAARKS